MFQTNEITRIRCDNPRDIRKAGEVVLHEWVRGSGITEFKEVNEFLGKAFSFSKLAGAYEAISSGKMRKFGKLVIIYTFFIVTIFNLHIDWVFLTLEDWIRSIQCSCVSGTHLMTFS